MGWRQTKRAEWPSSVFWPVKAFSVGPLCCWMWRSRSDFLGLRRIVVVEVEVNSSLWNLKLIIGESPTCYIWWRRNLNCFVVPTVSFQNLKGEGIAVTKSWKILLIDVPFDVTKKCFVDLDLAWYLSNTEVKFPNPSRYVGRIAASKSKIAVRKQQLICVFLARNFLNFTWLKTWTAFSRFELPFVTKR